MQQRRRHRGQPRQVELPDVGEQLAGVGLGVAGGVGDLRRHGAVHQARDDEPHAERRQQPAARRDGRAQARTATLAARAPQRDRQREPGAGQQGVARRLDHARQSHDREERRRPPRREPALEQDHPEPEREREARVEHRVRVDRRRDEVDHREQPGGPRGRELRQAVGAEQLAHEQPHADHRCQQPQHRGQAQDEDAREHVAALGDAIRARLVEVVERRVRRGRVHAAAVGARRAREARSAGAPAVVRSPAPLHAHRQLRCGLVGVGVRGGDVLLGRGRGALGIPGQVEALGQRLGVGEVRVLVGSLEGRRDQRPCRPHQRRQEQQRRERRGRAGAREASPPAARALAGRVVRAGRCWRWRCRRGHGTSAPLGAGGEG